MALKPAMVALAFVAMALAGCTAGSDGGGEGNTTETGGVGVGGTVSGPAGGVGGNASVSGSATATSTNGTSTGPGGNMTADVSIEGSKFMPDTVTVLVGGSVTWTHNDGGTAHTVTADDGSFNSSPTCAGPLPVQADCLTAGETFSATFTTVGEFPYHCKLHSGMTGTVRVVEE